MRSSILSAAAVALAALQLCSAQTFTSCDPTKKSCPADKALGRTVSVDFTKGASSEFTAATGTTLTYDGTNGAVFTINKESDAPTITSNWYFFFGKVDVVLKAAPGVGIVSSIVLESDDLDEVDWEFLPGAEPTTVQTNYFGKGNTTTYDRMIRANVASPDTTFHTYTVESTKDYIKWSIDGQLVRTLLYAQANGGSNFPQTPMQVKLGNWVGGGSTAPTGQVQWAGGLTDFSKAPFTMYVKSVTVQDYSTGAAQYAYGDMSGSWQSIKLQGATSNSGSSSSGAISGSGSVSAAGATTATGSAKASIATTLSTTVTTAPVASALSYAGYATTLVTGSSGNATAVSNGTAIATATLSGTGTGSAATAAKTVAAGSAGHALKANIVLVAVSAALGYLVL
jgi:beta-glucanase (GH16 family)